MLLPLQAAPEGPLAVAGTFASFAIFLSITAHIAARNVLGDVPVRNAFVVGPVPAAVSVLVATFAADNSAVIFLGVVTAILLDGVAIRALYEESTRLSAYITFIHFVVSVILGTIVFGLWALAISAPG
jgi:hypothetical protein